MPADGRRSYSRSLNDDSRRRAFGVAAVVLVAATVGIALLPDSERVSPRAQRARTEVVDAPSTAPAPSASATRAPTLAAAERPAILARARSFLRAYLAYEVGAADGDVARRLKKAASPSLARRLLDQRPARPPVDAPPRGRVRAVEFVDTSHPESVVVTATILRSGRSSPLTMQLDREGDTWRVTRIS
jgi:hypothetical protein